MSESKNKVDQNIIASDKNIEIWFEKNWKKCSLAIIVILVVGMTVFTTIYLKEQNTAKAAGALAAAKIADLPALLKKTPNAPGAAAARIRLADDLVAKKDYAGAKVQFNAIANDMAAAIELRSRAKLNSALCDELSGNAKAAAESFALLMNDSSISQLIRDEAGFQAGRIFVAIKDPRGEEILQKLANAPTDANMINPWKRNAQALLNQSK